MLSLLKIRNIALIDERVQVTHARDSGTRVDENELDRAVANVAQQNQITLPQLRQRLAAGNQWREHAPLAGGINVDGGKLVHPALQGVV